MSKGISIGCKLPHGVLLRLKNESGDMVEVVIKGTNAARIVGGHGITEDVDPDFWRAWLAKNAGHSAVVSGALFSYGDVKSVESEAKNRRKAVTGFEPLDPMQNGMLNGPDGKTPDKEALGLYNQQKRENPRNARAAASE